MSDHHARYGHMVQEYYVSRFRAAAADRAARRRKLRTRRDVERLQAELRRRIRRSFGPFPRRTPLNPRIAGTIRTPHATIETVLFESRPGLVVSANLYVPTGLSGPAPCVLGTCGHSLEGKAAEPYQSFSLGLARKGFVVLIYDPISQGERVQYPGPDGRPRLGLCPEHNMIGNQQALLGEFFGAWRAWDGIRALDYLLSRPEVDRRHVGVTGNSGGGTMTTWLCGLDDRITMAAPGCFVTTLRANLENELPADVEQIPPGLIALGLDQYELYVPLAPRPLILLTQTADFFDRRGSREAYEQLRRVYRLLGAERNLQIVTGPSSHGFSRHLREPMYAFFARHAGLRAPAGEPRLSLHTPEQLRATPGGSVNRRGTRRVFDFTREAADMLAAERRPLPAAKLGRTLSRLLVLPRRAGVPHHRVLRHRWTGKTVVARFAVETEPDIQAIVTMPVPPGERSRFGVPAEAACTLLVPHLGAVADLESPRLRRVLPARRRLFAVDVRGIGETTSLACGADPNFFAPYDNDYFYHAAGLLLGEPYLGRRTHDVLRTLDWLAGHGYRDIHLVGRGMGAILALFAAVLDPRPKKVTLVNGLLSYHELTQVPIQRWPASSLPGGVLRHVDLPDCYRALGSRLKLVEPWDARMKRLAPAAARRRIQALHIRGS